MVDLDFDLTPDPRVLIALTHTPLQPLDAVCELIDNGIDSFVQARLRGEPVEFPLVNVELPGLTEVNRGEGRLRVRDNGPGLTPEQAERALRAGYSGNNPHDSLGLFGMGFNIATGKLGERTRFVTARAADDFALEVLIDLPQMQAEHSYRVPTRQIEKPENLVHGTVVEVSGWWPEGNQNSAFIKKLSGYGKAAIRQEIGRRYATIIREQSVRVQIAGEACEAFEHCVWGANRFVEHRQRGQIPARFDFNEVLGSQTRCTECDTVVGAGAARCPECHASSFRTIEERVRGWVGIQRFDDAQMFGIDLMRNGRAIRVAEKGAFFEFTDEFKRTVKDYPIDSYFGRIIGEVHLDHVPVDFMKQDFQRTSEEWQRAIRYLRGGSSLQPQQPGASENTSYLFKLYQGYRRVRTPGRTDMYMGVWDPDKAKRVSRDVEKEYYEKFLARLPGYYDDEEWWKLVESADQPPLQGMVECPSCQAENLDDQEVCQVCGTVLKGQPCKNPECNETVALSAAICEVCGFSQIPEIEEPWKCLVCSHINNEEAEHCAECTQPRGSRPFGSREYVMASVDKDDDLSTSGMTVELADGAHSTPIDVTVYSSKTRLLPGWHMAPVPAITFKGESIEVVIDKTHPLFRSYRVRPEVIVASEVAQYLYDLHRGLLRNPYLATHTISNLTWSVLQQRWSDVMEDSPERVRDDARVFIESVLERLPLLAKERSGELFTLLSEREQEALTRNIIGRGLDIGRLGEWRATGDWLLYIEPETLVTVFRNAPDLFFDGNIWSASYMEIPEAPDAVLEAARRETRGKYLNCLEDVASFTRYVHPEPVMTYRARASLDFLSQDLT